jgi:uncharacterized protein with HEPN domain
MTRHDETTRLRHMLDYAQEAADMARNRQRQDLDSDRQFRFALTHLVEIVGEAAAHVSRQFMQAHTDIPWAGIIGLRNRLIHGYTDVDLDVLWKILHDDLPPLIEQIKKALDENA